MCIILGIIFLWGDYYSMLCDRIGDKKWFILLGYKLGFVW